MLDYPWEVKLSFLDVSVSWFTISTNEWSFYDSSGPSVSYKPGERLGFPVSLRRGSSEIDVDLFSPEYAAVRWMYLTRRYALDVYHYEYSGVGSVWGSRPDIHVSAFGANVTRVHNHERFSYRSVYQHAERQLRSAGSFLTGVSLEGQGVRGDYSLIPAAMQPDFGDLADLRGVSTVSASASCGYAYAFAWRRGSGPPGCFVVSLSLGAGLDVYRLDGGPAPGYGVGLSAKALMYCGWIMEFADRFHIGLTSTVDGVGNMISGGSVQFQSPGFTMSYWFCF